MTSTDSATVGTASVGTPSVGTASNAVPTAWSAAELLSTDPGLEPLIVAGYRCHGGFDADGAYHSPRTRFRAPAIAGWQERHRRAFGTEILHAPLDTWPRTYPNVAQTRWLLENGVREPVVATLTRIGTVEGFGALIRAVGVDDPQRFFDESIAGTAIVHLDHGLFEAHARDEAGYGNEYGHKHMWWAARDSAFENPVTQDETECMLARMGIAPAGPAPDPEAVRNHLLSLRRFADLDLMLEMMIQRMISILLIEVSAYHTFAWAEEVLGDVNLVAGDGEPARLVSYIRQDESPHVEYLRTALTEMRDRTFVTDSGSRLPGTEVIGTLWELGLAESLGPRREMFLATALVEVERAVADRRDRSDVMARFHDLGDVRPDDEGRFVAA